MKGHGGNGSATSQHDSVERQGTRSPLPPSSTLSLLLLLLLQRSAPNPSHTMSSWLPYDLVSILPRSVPSVTTAPSKGSKAPALEGVTFDKPTLVAFVRHCGCPFAQKEVQLLGKAYKESGEKLQIIIVQHADQAAIDTWWKNIEGDKHVPSAKVIADPEHNVYASWGIGSLSFFGLFWPPSLYDLVVLARKEGIVNTTTKKGAWRFQNSGGFAVDGDGQVLWSKIARHPGDVCHYDEVAKEVFSSAAASS